MGNESRSVKPLKFATPSSSASSGGLESTGPEGYLRYEAIKKGEDRNLFKEAMRKIGGDQLSFLDQVKAYEIANFATRGADPLPVLVQAFRLSDEVALVGLPGEVFVELGLAIKKASPFPTTMVVELSQDCPDYVPTRKAFAEGSYETVCSWIAPGGGEMLVAAAVELLKELKQ